MLSIAGLISLLSSMFRMSIPLIFATTGEVVAEKSGVINIGLEGQMLLGAFVSVAVSFSTGSVLIGILAAALVSAGATLIISLLGITRRQDQSVVGIMFTIFVTGLTSFLYRVFYGVSLTPPVIDTLPNLPIPGLSKIPVIGPTLFNQNILAYIAFIGAIATWFVLKKTLLGLKLRAVGENPRAAQAAGIAVNATRYKAMLFAGFMGGLGGAFLTTGYAGRFTEAMTAGRGYIALSIVIFGQWNPVFALIGALLFGFVDAFQLRAQAAGVSVPYQFFVMLPYVVVLLSILIMGNRAKAPSAIGTPFEKEGR